MAIDPLTVGLILGGVGAATGAASHFNPNRLRPVKSYKDMLKDSRASVEQREQAMRTTPWEFGLSENEKQRAIDQATQGMRSQIANLQRAQMRATGAGYSPMSGQAAEQSRQLQRGVGDVYAGTSAQLAGLSNQMIQGEAEKLRQDRQIMMAQYDAQRALAKQDFDKWAAPVITKTAGLAGGAVGGRMGASIGGAVGTGGTSSGLTPQQAAALFGRTG